ncbi:vWA domain-containing protein [Butyrivibrio sp. NC2007]|uniref:vWA domain-containing protein n=1 Tax=Butyrivibrio sp. NC2007 TaxID=1280683 RepID=UPI0003B6F26C|nr:VWA domain-containing protein [Butyrivibrio sp. NC2007]
MKKNYNRSLSLLLTAGMMAGTLAGCGQSSATQTSPQVYTDTSAEVYESPASAYESEAAPVCEEPLLGAERKGIFDVFSSSDNASESTYSYTAPDYPDITVVPEYNTESYDKPDENGFFITQGQPLSTFAADVDTASYANIRRMIESGYGSSDISPAAVRPEEFINYFSYDLNGPKKGEKFGVTTEVATCPWNEEHQLMFVGVKAEDKLDGEIPKSNLVFLIDVSGSMDSKNKLPLLQKAFRDLVDNLPDEGTVSIVTYASREAVILDGVSMADKKTIKNAISNLDAGGSTAGEAGMEMAYRIAKDNFIEGGNNRVIMATDGDLNVGISDPDDLERFIKAKKDDGIYLSVLGFGDGNYKDDALQSLADYGNGNYSYIDCEAEAHKVLVDEMSSTLVTVAKDVKFQVEFNPAVVNAYRLIGYENRVMDAVDFNNDKKDGGEVGSGHTVVALYEIIPVGAQSAIDLKYQQVESSAVDTGSDDFATIKIRYKEPDEDKSQLLTFVADKEKFTEKPSDNLAFAGLVSEFAMLLSESDYSGTIEFKDIMKAYKELDYTDDYREEFYDLVRMMAKRS